MPGSIVEMDGWVSSHRANRARFAAAKFQPSKLPDTLVTRSVLHDRLAARDGQRLTVVVGSAGAGKTVLLSSWVAARAPGMTSWLACDEADADPARFWAGFIESSRAIAPEFGADAAGLLNMDGAMSADVTASIANDAAKLPAGTAVIVDDFHTATSSAAGQMADLIERWPAGGAQLVLASRSDPPLRLPRLRMARELCEIRDRDLYFSLAECRDLLANFGVDIGADDLALLHQQSEGWAAALQMTALSLRDSRDPARVARTLDIRNPAIAEYIISEVLEAQPGELVQFMLDTSILDELTIAACAAITQRHDAAVLLRGIDAASLFLTALNDERTRFRYHHLVRNVLHAELRARDQAREEMLQIRAAEWFESTGDARRAARHFLAARRADRALDLIQDRVVPDYLRDPDSPAASDLSTVDPASLADTPARLLTLAADRLQSGDIARGGKCLDLLEHAQPPVPAESRLAARLAAMRSFHHAQTGHLDQAVEAAQAAQALQERTQLADEWNPAVPLILLGVYPSLEDLAAVERATVAAALAMPELPGPARLVLVPGARALAWFQAGHLAEASKAAKGAETAAQRLGFGEHFFAIDYLRVLAGLALEQRDLDTAEQLTERALSIAEQRRPLLEFLTLLDRAEVSAARGQTCEALATVETARQVLASPSPVLMARAYELEALLRLSSGDLRSPAELASGLPADRRRLLLAKVALASGNYPAAHEHLQLPSLGSLPPRRELVRQILLAAVAVERHDPTAASLLARVVHTARQGQFLNTVVTTAPQVTRYLVEHAPWDRQDPFLRQLADAALQDRTRQRVTPRTRSMLIEPLTNAEIRVLKLLPASSNQQIAATLYISRNTVKTHLRSVYQKLGVTRRSHAIERALDLSLL
jgi:LuxR family transcriptional regulator, maltose regulon positive regulatory protein